MLTGDTAGLIGGARLAEVAGDAGLAKQTTAKLSELLAVRADYEKDNTVLVVSMRRGVGGSHGAKVPRYLDLVPEAGFALQRRHLLRRQHLGLGNVVVEILAFIVLCRCKDPGG